MKDKLDWYVEGEDRSIIMMGALERIPLSDDNRLKLGWSIVESETLYGFLCDGFHYIKFSNIPAGDNINDYNSRLNWIENDLTEKPENYIKKD